MEEVLEKLGRIRRVLLNGKDEQQLDVIVFTRVSSLAWLTCGERTHVNVASSFGPVQAVVTQDKHYLVTNNIEAKRLRLETDLETRQGWIILEAPWNVVNEHISSLTYGKRVGTDGIITAANSDWHNVTSQVVQLRSSLSTEEVQRYREAGTACADAMCAAAYSIRPGMSEQEIAAILASEALKRLVEPNVVLVAVDDRIWSLRHPIPTSKLLKSYAMLVLGGRQRGLCVSLTRLVYFGSALEEKIEQQWRIACTVDSAMMSCATKAQGSLADIYHVAKKTYEDMGVAHEIEAHHQGGVTGFEPREILATPGSTVLLKKEYAYAFNPSVSGAKSEDTLVGGEIITNIRGWPMEIFGDFARPQILVREIE